MKQNDTPDAGSLSGLAKRWLKTQLKFHGDPIKAAQDRREAEAIEYEARERAEYEAGRTLVNALMPSSWREKLQSLERQNELGRQQRAEQDRASILARPHARVDLRFSGDVSGNLTAEIPVEVSWPDDDGSWVRIVLETVEPVAFGAHLFRGMQLAIPVADARTGTPVHLGVAAERYVADWDPLDAQIWLDSDASSFYWSSDAASPQFWPRAGLSSFDLIFPARDEMGQNVRVEGSISLPAEAHS
jgi:hypothetical protein